MKFDLDQFFRVPNYADVGNITSRLHLRFAAKYRPRRLRKMQEYFGITEDTTILDVGGSWVNWEYLEIMPRITILNIGPRPDVLPDQFEYVDQDARKMSFDTKSFDLCFSNSVIEHVGTWEDQQLVANEIRRVGRSYYVQTPNFHFFIEPHFIAPFIHWLPPGARRRLIRYFSLWGLTTRPSREEIDKVVSETVLLTKRQMSSLFPEAHFLPERVLGMQKSLIAAHRNVETEMPAE